MPVEHLTGASDVRCADYRNVPDPELIARRGCFVAEGRLVVRRLLAGRRLPVRSVLVTAPALAALQDVLAAHPALPVYVVPQAVMNEITGFNIHRGCLALGERPAPRPWQAAIAGARRVLVLERVANADNVGSAFRHAAAFGAGAVLLGPSCTDPFYRKAIRTSMGATLAMAWVDAVPWPETLRTLARDGWAVMAMTPAAGAPPLAEVAPAVRHGPVAVVLGHEGEGLTPDALSACTTRARIPMAAGVDSLNVATAAAIALYELSRDPSGRG